MTMEADLVGRAAAARSNPANVPSIHSREEVARQRSLDLAAQVRVATVQRDGKARYHFHGCASTVEQPYEMYDAFGPYTETVDRGAFDVTLAADPDVAFLLNHRDATMARTRSGTLDLSMSDEGLISDAYCNPERSDVRDLALAIDDGDIDQMSFAFRIVRGQWSPDYTEYRILEVDLDRGDVSAVNFGANPYTSISARAKTSLEAVPDLPIPVLRELAERANERLLGMNDTTAPADESPVARATSYAEALLRDELAS